MIFIFCSQIGLCGGAPANDDLKMRVPAHRSWCPDDRFRGAPPAAVGSPQCEQSEPLAQPTTARANVANGDEALAINLRLHGPLRSTEPGSDHRRMQGEKDWPSRLGNVLSCNDARRGSRRLAKGAGSRWQALVGAARNDHMSVAFISGLIQPYRFEAVPRGSRSVFENVCSTKILKVRR